MRSGFGFKNHFGNSFRNQLENHVTNPFMNGFRNLFRVSLVIHCDPGRFGNRMGGRGFMISRLSLQCSD